MKKLFLLKVVFALALSLSAMQMEAKIVLVSGKVTDALSGRGIEGVPVCDGTSIVLTGAKGEYRMYTDNEKSHLVYVLMPAGYEFSFDEYGCWADYRPLASGKESQVISFRLKPRTGRTDKCRLLVLGDPQQMSSRPHSAPSWNYVCEGMAKYLSSYKGDAPLYAVSLGDMVTNEIEVPGKAEAYLATQKNSEMRFFCIAGNHDHVQKAPTYFESVGEFCRWFGPYNYSFNIAGVHCIFLDSCAFRETPEVKLTEGLNTEALAFLEADLALVKKDVPVLIFTHCPMTKSFGGKMPQTLGYDRMVELLQGRNVEFWYGHIHFGSNWSYTQEELDRYAKGVKSLGSHLVMRCGGSWACSGEVGRDGSPRGFVELDVDGTSVRWQYHSLDAEYPHDMYLLSPGQFAEENLEGMDPKALYCNIYMWDNSWGMPEVWADGVKIGTMHRKTCEKFDAFADPRYMHYYPIWKSQGRIGTREEPAKMYDNSHLFEFVVPDGLRSISVRVTDKWGRLHSSGINW